MHVHIKDYFYTCINFKVVIAKAPHLQSRRSPYSCYLEHHNSFTRWPKRKKKCHEAEETHHKYDMQMLNKYRRLRKKKEGKKKVPSHLNDLICACTQSLNNLRVSSM